ncbi:unnamed protein product, partial [Allacma fusca]
EYESRSTNIQIRFYKRGYQGCYSKNSPLYPGPLEGKADIHIMRNTRKASLVWRREVSQKLVEIQLEGQKMPLVLLNGTEALLALPPCLSDQIQIR